MLRVFFLSAVWLLLLATAVQMIDYFLRAHEIFRSHMPGFSARIVLGPLVVRQPNNYGFSWPVNVQGKARLAVNGHSPLQEPERCHGR